VRAIVCADVSASVCRVKVAAIGVSEETFGTAGALTLTRSVPPPPGITWPTAVLVLKPGPEIDAFVTCAAAGPVFVRRNCAGAGALPPQSANPKSRGAVGYPVTLPSAPWPVSEIDATFAPHVGLVMVTIAI
jgi:hypothetical protein